MWGWCNWGEWFGGGALLRLPCVNVTQLKHPQNGVLRGGGCGKGGESDENGAICALSCTFVFFAVRYVLGLVAF